MIILFLWSFPSQPVWIQISGQLYRSILRPHNMTRNGLTIKKQKMRMTQWSYHKAKLGSLMSSFWVSKQNVMCL
jgi:hypothetical protein